MARVYRVTFSGVSVTAAQDLVQITGPTAGKVMRIRRHWVTDATSAGVATSQSLRLRARRLPATVTVGSGGTTGVTPSALDKGDAACSSSTCATNNTTPATTGGTAVVHYANGCHAYNGDDHRYADDARPVIGPSEAFVFELLSTATGTLVLSGGVELEEIG